MRAKLLLEKELEPIFLRRFPPLSENVKELLVSYGPYVILVLSLIGVAGLMMAFGLGGVALGLGAVSTGLGFSFYVGVIMGMVTLVMYLMAFSPLRARKRSGWNLVYYALLIGLLSNLVQQFVLIALGAGVIGFWVLFQIREKYS